MHGMPGRPYRRRPARVKMRLEFRPPRPDSRHTAENGGKICCSPYEKIKSFLIMFLERLQSNRLARLPPKRGII